jgi:hypothetical protein
MQYGMMIYDMYRYNIIYDVIRYDMAPPPPGLSHCSQNCLPFNSQFSHCTAPAFYTLCILYISLFYFPMYASLCLNICQFPLLCFIFPLYYFNISLHAVPFMLYTSTQCHLCCAHPLSALCAGHIHSVPFVLYTSTQCPLCCAHPLSALCAVNIHSFLQLLVSGQLNNTRQPHCSTRTAV